MYDRGLTDQADLQPPQYPDSQHYMAGYSKKVQITGKPTGEDHAGIPAHLSILPQDPITANMQMYDMGARHRSCGMDKPTHPEDPYYMAGWKK